MIKKGICIILVSTLLTSVGQILLKYGLAKGVLNPPLALGLIAYIASGFLLVYALKFGDLSVLYPVIATSYVWVAILSLIFFGEKLSLMHASGTFLILLGVSLLGRDGRW